MIYTLAVFLPWVAFSLKGRIFSTIFSFILWIILGYNIFNIVFLEGGVIFRIYLLLDSFFLWVVLTTWCCLVMHSDQRQEDMERLINAINGIVKANSSKSLHPETQQASENKTNDMKQSISETAQANSNEANATRIFICVAIFFLAIILLVVFFRKGGYQSSNNQSIDAKNPSHKHYKKNSNRSN
ncbi:flagellar biosynthesis protein FlgG [Helicobacter pylori]|uniref:flagellar biosynthesis protein FlgG n=1 Tax=Helicobacter pylori TaxID=210 RepID=UPI000EAB62AD|nr:flagellar biosynthesis protein FlgG [Helicobacter pylori]